MKWGMCERNPTKEQNTTQCQQRAFNTARNTEPGGGLQHTITINKKNQIHIL